jgi:hypothetical protein
VNGALPAGERPGAAPTRLPAVASSGLADLLRGERRTVTVLARFDRAIYLGHGRGVLAVEASDGFHLPNGVAVTSESARRPLAAVGSASRGLVGGGEVQVGDLVVRVVRWRRARPVLRRVPPGRLRRRRDAAADLAAGLAEPLPAALDGMLGRLVAALRAGADEEAYAIARERMLGFGPGLTPSGDDVLAGLIAGTQLLAEAVVGSDELVVGSEELTRLGARAAELGRRVALAAPDATTAISAALLGHAVDGEVARPAASVLAALVGSGDLEPAVARLLVVGSSSGRDLCAGLLAAADLVGASAVVSTGGTR